MKLLLTISIIYFSLCANSNTKAQTFSYDGNRWYEIEVSIFTNQNLREINQELFLPDYVELTYHEPILQLTPALIDYSIDFIPADSIVSNITSIQEQSIDLMIYGPELREANKDYRLIDKARDPFISLGEEEHEFTLFNQNINQSPYHRILFHAVWRQPVLNKVQASAIIVSGGNRYGRHTELEGSLLISYNINRVDVDTRIWLNSFNVISAQEWDVLLPPITDVLDDDNEDSFDLLIDQVYPMQEIRQMISNELHYLDHPAIGMLIEVRPYELPPLFDFSLE
ncbi:MAG: CsiV family protein [Pseudohongiellaceae bacterium]